MQIGSVYSVFIFFNLGAITDCCYEIARQSLLFPGCGESSHVQIGLLKRLALRVPIQGST